MAGLNSEPGWADYLAEYEDHFIGPLWMALILDAVRWKTARYPAPAYAAPGGWDEQAVQDLVQDLVEQRLIRAGQMSFIVDQARSARQAANLIAFQTGQVLARRRARSQVDNVASRILKLAGEVADAAGGSKHRYFLRPGSRVEPRSMSHAEVIEAVARLRSLPTLPNQGSDRLSAVYKTKDLRQWFLGVLSDVTDSLSGDDIYEICRQTLSALAPTVFLTDEDLISSGDEALTPEEETIVGSTVDGILSEMTDEERILAKCVFEGQSQATVARVLGVSRPTAANRLRAAMNRLRDLIDEADPHLHHHVAGGLADKLSAPRSSDGDHLG